MRIAKLGWPFEKDFLMRGTEQKRLKRREAKLFKALPSMLTPHKHRLKRWKEAEGNG